MQEGDDVPDSNCFIESNFIDLTLIPPPPMVSDSVKVR